MKVTFADGAELAPILATGGTRYVQGANRDTLTFVFPAEAGLEALDAAFSTAACETITVDGANVYKGYTIRAELKKQTVEVTEATMEAEAVTEERILVSMSQRTYAESQLAAMAGQISMQEECIVELANIVYA